MGSLKEWARYVALMTRTSVEMALSRNNPGKEGFRVAWARWCWNVRTIIDRTDYYTAGERQRAWDDLTHSYVNVHVEAAREFIPDPYCKWVGKGIVATEVGVLVAAIVWPILAMT